MFFKDFDHNYYNNLLKYAANRTLFSKTPVTVNTKTEVYLKDFFSKFEKITTPDAFTFPEETMKKLIYMGNFNLNLFVVFSLSSCIILDTPGQIEVFTWSASGAIITETLASTFPTIIVYVMDTSRSANPVTFMSNMLYACSIMYKTRLPFVVLLNKVKKCFLSMLQC